MISCGDDIGDCDCGVTVSDIGNGVVSGDSSGVTSNGVINGDRVGDDNDFTMLAERCGNVVVSADMFGSVVGNNDDDVDDSFCVLRKDFKLSPSLQKA